MQPIFYHKNKFENFSGMKTGIVSAYSPVMCDNATFQTSNVLDLQ